jgi:hypothetical protein
VTRTTSSILYGWLVVGVLDGLDAVVFLAFRGVKPARVFQGIAGGLLGRASFEGGLATVLLGVAIHFFIAFCVVATYILAARKLPVLWRRPFLCGPIYGIGVHVFMRYAVIPLSLAGTGRFNWPGFVNIILAHALLVGLPSALFARRAFGPR